MTKPPIPYERIVDLLSKTSKDNPAPEDVRALRVAMEQIPQLVEVTGNLSIQCQMMILNSVVMNQASRQAIEVGLVNLRNSLGYESCPPLERMLIEQVMLCHLRLYIWEYLYHQSAGQGLEKESLQRWENLVNAAQKRYFRAIETLVRVRRLGIQIQVNIAADGGQQVNIGSLNNNQL